MIKKWDTGGEHIGSWTVEVGDLDEASMHFYFRRNFI